MSVHQEVHHNGSCLCEKIKYEATGKVYAVEHCHCKMCQKSSGSPFLTWVCLDKESVKVFGETGKFQSSENVIREFCQQCGSPLFFNYISRPEVYFFSLGTLDDINALLPTRHIWFDRRPKWLCMSDNLPFENGN